MKKLSAISVLFPIALLFAASASAYCEGEVKHYQIPEAGEAFRRMLSVYLPEGYGETGTSYPVLYLLHESGGSDLTFLGGGYPNSGGSMSHANAGAIVERLLHESRTKPLIVACPNLGGTSQYDIEYLLRRVVPFVDATFRTIPTRESRAIAGHSDGGFLSLYVTLSYPEFFSIAGGFSSYLKAYFRTQLDDLVRTYNKTPSPTLFWLYAGRQNQYGMTPENKDFADFLNKSGLPATYIEDDGDHTNQVAERLAEYIEYLSKHLKW